MAKAKKLPSGQWRTLVYSHTETVDGKAKRNYESFTSDSRRESEYLAAEFALTKNQRQKPNNMTVNEAMTAYIEGKNNILSASTVLTYTSTANAYYGLIKDVPLKNLTQELIQQDINLISASLSPKTVKNIHGLLSATLAVYLPEFRITTSLPHKTKYEPEIPSSEDIKHMLEAAEGKTVYIAILLASTLGLRRGEIAGQRWRDINLKNATLTVKTSLVLDKDRHWVEKPPKSYAGNRVLDIPDFVLQFLKTKRKGMADSDRVIDMLPSSISNAYNRIIESLGMTQYRFHDLRHYYASMMLSINIPDKYAMRRMGHATNDTLKNIYQHTIPQKEQSVTDDINAFLATNISNHATRNATQKK